MATRTISNRVNRLLQFGSSSSLHSTSFNGLDSFIASADFSTASSTIRGFSFPSSNSLNSFSRYTDARQISQLVHSNSNGKRSFLVDTLALVRRLEAQGVPTKQAEGITRDVIEVLNDNLETVVQSFISKADMQKIEVVQESSLSKFKSEVEHLQDHQFGMLQRETERLKGELEKLRSELRHEIDKVTAGQRLDLNLEKGRIREEFANQTAETNHLTQKIDREIHSVRVNFEASKTEVIKYGIGLLVSAAAVGLACLRLMSQ